MNKYLKYFKTICIHKWYVFIECCKQGIIWQGIIHDMSKFSPSEFIASARYFNGDKNDREYQYAWIHHKNHNKHHWQYWVDIDSETGEFILPNIPIKYMKEMYADMVGASKTYNRNKFDYKEPFTYFATKCKGWKINTDNSAWLANKLFVLSSDSMLHNINKYEK